MTMRPLGVPVAAGSTPSGEGAPSSGPVAATLTADLQARLFAMVTEMRRRQGDQRNDLTATRWELADHELETLVPRLAARIERLESHIANLENAFSICAEVALHASEKADSAMTALDSADTVIIRLGERVKDLESKLADLLPSLQ